MSVIDLGYAFWKPIVWVIAFVVVMVITFLFRSRGQKKYKKGTDQAKIFLSGEEVPEPEQRHVRAGNVYWGFFEALKGYYDVIVRPHTGIVNDYIIWFVAVIGIGAIILVIAG